jgi:hypothetical protein
VWWTIVPLLEDKQRLLELTGLEAKDDQKPAADVLKALDAKAANLEEAITKRAADALAAGLAPDVIASAVERLQDELDALNTKREKAASWQDTAKERKERRARLSVLARASLKLLNAKDDLEFQRTLLALLDVKVDQTEEGSRFAASFARTCRSICLCIPRSVVRGTAIRRRPIAPSTPPFSSASTG